VAKMPLNVSKLVEAWKEVSTSADRTAGIVLAGDPTLVGQVQERLASGGTLPATWVRPLTDLTGLSSVPGELLVLLVSPEEEAGALAAIGDPAPRGGAIIADASVCPFLIPRAGGGGCLRYARMSRAIMSWLSAGGIRR
jgi:hypothetical protein